MRPADVQKYLEDLSESDMKNEIVRRGYAVAWRRCDGYELGMLPGVLFCRKDGARIVHETIRDLTAERTGACAEAQRERDLARAEAKEANTHASIAEKNQAEAQLKLENLAERFRALETENNERRRQLAAVRTDRDNVHVWTADDKGEDAKSLVCPVVMTADTLRKLLEPCNTCEGDGFIEVGIGATNADGEPEGYRAEPCPECDLVTKLRNQLVLSKAEAVVGGSLLLDVQQDCINATKALNAVTEQRNSLNARVIEFEENYARQAPFIRGAVRDRDNANKALAEMTSARDGLRAEVGRLEERLDDLAKEVDAACRANDALKQTLDVLGCKQLPGGSWVNDLALDREADLHALRCAVRKVHAWRETGAMVELDATEQAAWDAATH